MAFGSVRAHFVLGTVPSRRPLLPMSTGALTRPSNTVMPRKVTRLKLASSTPGPASSIPEQPYFTSPQVSCLVTPKLLPDVCTQTHNTPFYVRRIYAIYERYWRGIGRYHSAPEHYQRAIREPPVAQLCYRRQHHRTDSERPDQAPLAQRRWGADLLDRTRYWKNIRQHGLYPWHDFPGAVLLCFRLWQSPSRPRQDFVHQRDHQLMKGLVGGCAGCVRVGSAQY